MTPRRAPLLAATIALLVVAACATSTRRAVPRTAAGPGRHRTRPDADRHPDRSRPSATPSPTPPDRRGQRRRQRASPSSRSRRRPGDPARDARGPGGQGLAAGHRRQRRAAVRPARDRGRDGRHRAGDHRDRDPRRRGRRRRSTSAGYADGTAAAGGCHPTLHVCVDSDGFRLPHNDNGRLRVRLSVADRERPARDHRRHGRLAGRAVRPRAVGGHRHLRLVRLTAAAPRACGDRASSPGMLVGRGGIEPPQPKARVLQTFGLTTCPTDPRWWR